MFETRMPPFLTQFHCLCSVCLFVWGLEGVLVLLSRPGTNFIIPIRNVFSQVFKKAVGTKTKRGAKQSVSLAYINEHTWVLLAQQPFCSPPVFSSFAADKHRDRKSIKCKYAKMDRLQLHWLIMLEHCGQI